MMFWSDPVAFIANWFSSLLESLNLPDWASLTIRNLAGGLVVAGFALVILIFLIWVERKISARFQDRLGPNRAGPYGLFQTVADVVKLMIKEDITPDRADKVVFNIAPVISLTSVILIWAVVPFSQRWFGADLNVGVLYIAAVGSFGILSVLMAGWASNNKYSLLGAFRVVAQLVSYEVPLFIALMVPVLLSGTMGVNGIVSAQETWYVLIAPLAALIFFISSVAEIGRSPFDLIEADSEIVAGYVIEYSGMKFAMFFAAEFLHAFVIGVLTALLFLGGWRGPGVDQFPLLGPVYLMIKSFAVYFVALWLRSTLPRLRIDHMMDFNWKFLTPLSLTVLMVTAVVDKLVAEFGMLAWRLPALLLANGVLVLVVFLLTRAASRRRKSALRTFEPRPVAVAPKPAEAE